MRKLATAAAVSLVLASGGVRALGLGDIEMRSALNQPMNAEIRLTSVKSGELEGMIVQLASSDAFTRAGIERTKSLQNLQFTVDESGGVPVIRITSNKPVIEPFLNFLLEVDWPQGRMVREYTVLLDPPVFMTPSATQRNTASDTPAVVERGEESLLTPTPIERDSAADGEEVALDGLLDEAATATAADAGEAVSLDSLEAGADSAALSDSNGDAVSLTDLNAPNPDAKAEFAAEQQARQSAALDEIPDVELLGSATEVTDEFVVGAADAVQTDDVAADDDGEIVSLDDESDRVALEEDSEVVSLDDIASEQSTAAEQVADKEITVKSGDTLYELAQSNLADGVSVQQMMMSLLNTNQSAFINNNINLVKAGAVIRIPQASEAKALSQAQALAEIGKQNQLWQEYRDNLRSTAATQVADADDTAKDKPASNVADAAGETDALSDDAKSILDNARSEVLDRDELSIVADSEPSSTTASATADESDASDTQRLGEINRKLQLAREELASERLESEELGSQASDLQHTTENLDALVTLRQNEVSQLEAQLADARERGANAAADAADAAGDAAADVAEAAGDELQVVATDTADNAADVLADASSAASDATAEVADAGSNALTQAGEKLESVELIDGDADDEIAANGEVDIDTAASTDESVRPQGVWYENILNDKNKLALAGVGGAGLLGLGALLFWRRRRDDDELLDFDDEVEFIDEGEAASLQAEVDATVGRDDADPDSSGGFVTGAAAGAAAAGGAFAAGSDAAAADLPEFTTASDQLADVSRDEDIDKDDTISEADVYLAYGLHGQAEELLTGAIQRDPNNPEYAHKLLQTYHAQGNAEAFDTTAQDFHARFGGDNNPEWPGIAAMGLELQPENDAYAAAAASVSSIGMGDHNAPKLDEEDFLAAGLSEGSASSVTRDFSAADDVLEFTSEDESALMDQSIDPAFAFDESDLEATGDFSQIASEMAVENTESIDFPDFDSSGNADDVTTGVDSGISSAKGAIAGAAAGIAAAGAAGTADSLDPGDALDTADVFDAADSFEDALSLDELDVGLPTSGAANDGFEELDLSSVADDLTLDLEQLSGDMELDSSELLDGSLGGVDLEIPDLTSDNELLDGVAGNLDSADEMDTMLDLAKAYIDMGDKDSASSALGEIVKAGSPEQVSEAETLLRKIS